MLKRTSLLIILPLLITPVSIVNAELVAHYTFDDADVNGDTILDVSGSEYNGTKTNGGPLTSVAGKIGQAARFDGGSNNEDNHFVDLSDHADTLGQLIEGTLAAWIKPVTTEEAGGPDGHLTDVLTIFAASDATQGSAEMRWVVHTATSPFGAGGPGGAIEHGSQYLGARGADFSDHLVSDMAQQVNLLDGDWHHVAVTVDGDSQGTLFIDGSEADAYYVSDSEAISFMGDIQPDGPDTLGIGRNKDSAAGGGQWFYHGLIDDFRIYNEALSASEVQALFNLADADPLDFHADGVLDIADLNRLVDGVRTGDAAPAFDVNGDGSLDFLDIQQFVESPVALNSWIGDANLDGEFNSSDFVSVFTAGLYESGNPADWSQGDWNGNGFFDSGDFVSAFTSGGFELGPRGAIASVPEPSSFPLLFFGTIAACLVRKHRSYFLHF